MPSFSSRGKCKSSYGGVQRRAIFTEVNVKTCRNSFGGKCLIHHKLKRHCFSANGPKLCWKYLQCLRLTGDCHKIVSLDPLHTCVFSVRDLKPVFCMWLCYASPKKNEMQKGERHSNDMPISCQNLHAAEFFPLCLTKPKIWKEATQSPERHFSTPQFGGNWTAKK